MGLNKESQRPWRDFQSESNEKLTSFFDFWVLACKIPRDNTRILTGADDLASIKLKLEDSWDEMLDSREGVVYVATTVIMMMMRWEVNRRPVDHLWRRLGLRRRC